MKIGFKGYIKNVYFLEDDKSIIVGYNDNNETGKIRIYKIATQKKSNILDDINRMVNFKMDSNRTIIAIWTKRDNYLKVWNIKENKLLFSLKLTKQIKGISFNRKSTKLLCWGYDNRVRLIDLLKKNILLEYQHNSPINGANFTKNEQKIISWSKDKSIKVWSITKNKSLQNLKHNGNIEGITISEDEKYLLSWSYDYWITKKSEVRLWSLIDGKLLLTFDYNTPVNSAIFSKNMKKILISSQYIIQLYSLVYENIFDNQYYPLKTQVETGAYLTPSGEVKALTKKEWLQKKKKYNQILKEQI